MEHTTQQPREQGIGTMSKSMLIVILLTMVSKVTGFLREMVFASQFGAEAVNSAFKTAQDLPCIFLSIIVTALSATLIPAYSGQLKQGRDKANRFVNNLFTVGMVFSVVVLILTGIFMEPIANFIMRETDDLQTRQLAIQLAQTMLPMGIFVFLARITSAYLQANFNFTIPAISQLFLNLVIIGAIMLSQGVNVTYVAIGTVIGWALQFAVQIPAVKRTGLSYRPVFDVKESGLREVMMLMLPVIVASSFDQLYILFDKMVAFRGDIGDPGRLDYANRLTTMISSVLLTTVATVLYPNLVGSVHDRKKFTDNLSFGVNLNLLIALPAMAAMILLSTPIIRLVYERGKFLPEHTALTAPLLACYAAGIFGVGIRELFNRCFYAFKDTVVPTIVGVGVVLLNVGLNYALHAIMGAPGIAAATSISTTLSGFLLMILLRRKNHVLDGKRILRCLWKTAAATAAMALVTLGLYTLLHLGTQSGMLLLLYMIITFVVAIAVYLGVLLALKTEELTLFVDMLKKKLRRNPA